MPEQRKVCKPWSCVQILPGDRPRDVTLRRNRIVRPSIEVSVRHPPVVVPLDLVPDPAAGVRPLDVISSVHPVEALQGDCLPRIDLADPVVLWARAVSNIDIANVWGIEDRRGDVVRTRRRCRDHRSGDNQQHAHTERHQLSCFARLVHRDPPRAELRQSSDRNFDVLHDVLLVPGGGTRVHPICPPGAI